MMSRDGGSPDSRVWLLGDSEPENSRKKLSVPLDARHPARHNIWTPVLNVAQGRLYELERLRFNDAAVYVRNAVASKTDRPRPNARTWLGQVEWEIAELARLIKENKPLLIFSFGAFSHEFALRALCVLGTPHEPQRFDRWTTKALGACFLDSCRTFDVSTLPLSLGRC
jgi:hypothetical protein